MSKNNNPINKTVFREDLGLSAIQSIEAVDFIKDCIFAGYERSVIHSQIKERYKLSESQIEKLVASAYNFIETFSLDKMDLLSVIDVHVGFYEKIYQWFDSVGDFYGKRKTLQAKEKLLGFHQQVSTLTLNQENILEIQITDDYARLDKDEKARLQFLMNKANVTS